LAPIAQGGQSATPTAGKVESGPGRRQSPGTVGRQAGVSGALADVLTLQREAGNQAVAMLIQRCCGGGCSSVPPPEDVATQVLRRGSSLLQRSQMGASDEEEVSTRARDPHEIGQELRREYEICDRLTHLISDSNPRRAELEGKRSEADAALVALEDQLRTARTAATTGPPMHPGGGTIARNGFSAVAHAVWDVAAPVAERQAVTLAAPAIATVGFVAIIGFCLTLESDRGPGWHTQMLEAEREATASHERVTQLAQQLPTGTAAPTHTEAPSSGPLAPPQPAAPAQPTTMSTTAQTAHPTIPQTGRSLTIPRAIPIPHARRQTRNCRPFERERMSAWVRSTWTNDAQEANLELWLANRRSGGTPRNLLRAFRTAVRRETNAAYIAVVDRGGCVLAEAQGHKHVHETPHAEEIALMQLSPEWLAVRAALAESGQADRLQGASMRVITTQEPCEDICQPAIAAFAALGQVLYAPRRPYLEVVGKGDITRATRGVMRRWLGRPLR
jgi:pyrimidine deaminase RibD-like protein